jgi:hypothetical protein
VVVLDQQQRRRCVTAATTTAAAATARTPLLDQSGRGGGGGSMGSMCATRKQGLTIRIKIENNGAASQRRQLNSSSDSNTWQHNSVKQYERLDAKGKRNT